MNLSFWKMHGAGNDFVLIDDRELRFPLDDAERLRKLAVRRTGIGCEGIILIQPSDRADFRMRFFNPDGREVEMCGNGARCVARLAHDLGAAPEQMTIETVAGILKAGACGDRVRLGMTPPLGWRTGGELAMPDGAPLRFGFVNTGVPHVVVETDDLDACDVHTLGSAIRYHAEFAPSGTNANFMRIEGADGVRVRTYERGVEGETLACGTGVVASALIAARLDKVRPPVKVRTASGDTLTVSFRLTQDGAEDVVLEGPAVYVFTGTAEL